MQVRTWGLLAYDRIEYFTSRRKEATKQTRKDNNKYTGQITEFSKKKLRKAIQLIVASSQWKEAPNFKTGKTFKFKVNFITLTLPTSQGTITDKQIKQKCLDPFIKRLKRKHKLGSYVWRAERQDNGNLHFHMITDTWIHFQKIRNDWNDCCQHFGMIDQFEKKHKHRNPNSTDVHAVWKIKNLSQYFIKYMTKGESKEEVLNLPFRNLKPSRKSKKEVKETKYYRLKSREENKIDGKIWDCSANLKTKGNCEFLLEEEASQIWNEAYNHPETVKKSDPNFTLIFLNDVQFKEMIRGGVNQKWQEYLKGIREKGKEQETRAA